MNKNIQIISGVIIESTEPLSFDELCHAVQLQDEILQELIEHQIIQPFGKSRTDWRFDSLCLRRARLAASFYHDLDINLAGIGLALDLLDRIEQLERQLKEL